MGPGSLSTYRRLQAVSALNATLISIASGTAAMDYTARYYAATAVTAAGVETVASTVPYSVIYN